MSVPLASSLPSKARRRSSADAPATSPRGAEAANTRKKYQMRTVPDRRQGAAVAFLAEIVTAFHGRGRMLPLGQPGRGRLESGQHPVNEGATRCVGVLTQHSQLGRLLWHP